MIAFNQLQAARREHEEAAVDQATVAAGFLGEAGDPIAVALQCPIATRWANSGNRGPLAMIPVEGDQGTDVDVAQAIAVSEAEGVFALEIVTNALESSAGLGVIAGVDQRDAPGLGVALVYFHVVGGHVEGHIRHVQEVVGEVFLDDVALVTAADDEVVHAMGGVELEDVPEDGAATDLDHGLGLEVGFLGDAGAEATG